MLTALAEMRKKVPNRETKQTENLMEEKNSQIPLLMCFAIRVI